MYDIVNWFIEHRHDPITLGLIGSFLLLMIDKLGRNLITSQVKRLLHMEDNGLKRIEAKVDLLLQKEGIEWGGVGSNGTISNPSKEKTGFTFSWVGKSLAHFVGKSIIYLTRRGKMKMQSNVNYVTLLAALLGAVKLILQAYGYEIPDEHINAIVNGVAAIISLVGVVMSHKKEGAVRESGIPIQPNK